MGRALPGTRRAVLAGKSPWGLIILKTLTNSQPSPTPTPPAAELRVNILRCSDTQGFSADLPHTSLAPEGRRLLSPDQTSCIS